jgi:hypothetical protein
MWDSKFDNIMFHGGGSNITGVAALRLMSGLQLNGSTYRQTKESFFSDCWFESYYGPALETGRPGGYVATKTEMLHFINIKMESNITQQPHTLFSACSYIRLRNYYMTHKYTAGAIMDLNDARGIEGAVNFVRIQAGDSVVPTELVRFRSTSYLNNLLIGMAEPQAATDNVVTVDNTAEATNVYTINAPNPRVNGATIRNKVQLGGYWIWVDSTGVIRKKSSVPITDLDGSPVTDRPNVNSTALLDATNAINTTGKYQGKQVYCTSVAKYLHTNGSTATSPWLNADATTAFTPV